MRSKGLNMFFLEKKSVLLIIAVLVIAVLSIFAIGYRYLPLDLFFGKIYLKYSYYDLAINKFKSILQRDSSNAEVRLYLGLAYGKSKDYQKALDEFQWIKDKGRVLGSSAWAYNSKGEIYYVLGMYEQAIGDFQKAVELNKNFREAYFNLACALSASGRRENAIAAYEKVLLHEPNNGYAHRNLASALEKSGDTAGAQRHWKKYIEFVSKSSGVTTLSKGEPAVKTGKE